LKSLYQAGNCLEQLGRIGEARDRYTKAIALVEKSHDSFGWPYQGMARLLLDEKPEAASEFAKKAVSLQPDEYSNHAILSKVYERLGDLPVQSVRRRPRLPEIRTIPRPAMLFTNFIGR